MNILFITQLLPYPVVTGGTVKTFKIISELSKTHNLTMVTFHDSIHGDMRVKELESLLNIRIFSFYRPECTKPSNQMMWTAFRSIFSKKPFRIYKYFDNRVVDIIQQLTQRTCFDCVYLDHDTSYQYLQFVDNAHENNILSIYDEHNVDSIASFRSALKSNRMILSRLLFLWDAIKYWFLEKEICRVVHKIACISEVDKQLLFRRGGVSDQLSLLSLPYKTEAVYQFSGNKSILFVGLMSWAPNKLGFLWFLDNVYPLIKAKIPDVTVSVIGGRVEADLLCRMNNDHTIRFLGEVPQTKPYYHQASVVIIPIHIGGGIRIKLLEAMSFGMPIVSTTIGAEGVFTHIASELPIQVTDDVRLFAQHVMDFMVDRKKASTFGKKAINFMKSNYSQQIFDNQLTKIFTKN